MKRFFSFVTAICLVFTMLVPALANSYDPSDEGGYVYATVDINALGDGFLVEPIKVPFSAGESYAYVTDRLFSMVGISYTTWGLDSGFYMSKLTLPRDINVDIPQIIMDAAGSVYDGNKNQGESLGEFDYTSMSGWMYTVNNQMAPMGASDWFPEDGDVLRWQFSVTGYGADLGADTGWGDPPLYVAADRGALLTKVAEINSSPDKATILAKGNVLSAYNNAYEVLTNLTATQAQSDGALSALTAALDASTPSSSVDISNQLESTLAYIVSTVTNPTYASVGGEWAILSLARAGYAVPDGYNDIYLNNIENYLQNAGSPGPIKLHSSKSTENSRLILALSSLGIDANNIFGYDLISPLDDLTWLKKQGLNGPLYALIALDTNKYPLPTSGSDRDFLIDAILSYEANKGTANAGGFSLGGGSSPDVDMSAMTLQGLAPYRFEREDVAQAIDRALTWMSSVQNASGGFASWGTVNAESVSQVICALAANGLDPATDSRFVKNGNNLLTSLLSFYVDGGGFRHTADQTSADAMASEQGCYALVAYDRFVNNKNTLYDMSDAFGSGSNDPQDDKASLTLDGPDAILGKAGTGFNLLVKTDAFPQGDYKLLDGIINIPDEFSVENLSPSGRLSGGDLTWNYNATDKKLRFVYTNTSLNNINFSGSDFPAELLSIGLKVKTDINTALTPSANITIGGATLKEASDKKAFVFDVSQASHTVNFNAIALTVRELFTGDGIDLIDSDKRALAVTLGTIDGGKKLAYKGTQLFYSPEMTAKHGVETYVLFTSPAEPEADLLNSVNYSLEPGLAQTVRFADTDNNGIINAQDALDVISAWLRKTAVTTDLQILTLNVTSDSRINTFDALAVMEYYVSNSEFAIVSK